MSETYGIADLAREFDVTTRTIRFHEDKGLIGPIRRKQLSQCTLPSIGGPSAGW